MDKHSKLLKLLEMHVFDNEKKTHKFWVIFLICLGLTKMMG